MKKIYFVRHGESEGNAGKVWQVGNSPLSQKGKEQAEILAARLVKIQIDAFLSSTMDRARETSAIINGKLNKSDLCYSDLLAERRRPSIMQGKNRNDLEAKKAFDSIIDNFHLPGYRFSDEENFDDLKIRAREVLELIANRPEDNILVVTHGMFMKVLLSYVTFGDNLTGKECGNFLRAFLIENTGITVLHHDLKHKNPWYVHIWNDHAHLG